MAVLSQISGCLIAPSAEDWETRRRGSIVDYLKAGDFVNDIVYRGSSFRLSGRMSCPDELAVAHLSL